MKTSIIVNLQIEGIHSWPQATEIEPEVAFLAHPHRHIFYIKCIKEVQHNDRDVEIILFKRKIISYLQEDNKSGVAFFGRMSCEEIATNLVKKFDLKSCEVLEDGENGAIVEQ